MQKDTPCHRKQFIKTFNSIANHRHRYEVFRDFVTIAAISLHKAINKIDVLEQEYLQVIGRYEREEVNDFCKLLAHVIEMLEPEPRDVLGALYMELELGNDNTGQFLLHPMFR